MLACARIGAIHNVVFGGFSAESVGVSHGVLRGQGADHRRRARRKGKTAPIQQVDEVMPDLPCIVVRHTGVDVPMAGKDAWFSTS